MPLTPEGRAEINRQNAAKSTGPKTDEGKANSRRNALKHGLRAEALALPNEDPSEVAGRSDAWNEYYRPQGPAAQHLVNACVAATLLSDRCRKYHEAALTKQVRDAELAWDEAREDQVDALVDLLATDPRAATRRLSRTSHGCRYLIERWEELREALVTRGAWTGPERDEAIRLQGFHPEPNALRECPAAWLTRLYALLCHENPSGAAVAWLFQSACLPDLYRDDHRPDYLPERDHCRESLREMIDAKLEPLRTLEEVIRTESDEPDRDGAAARAMILHDGPSARLFLRYHAEARTAFHRAYGSLVKALESDAAVETAPNEADSDSAPVPAGAEITAGSEIPNEANSDASPEEKMVSIQPAAPTSGADPLPPRDDRSGVEPRATAALRAA